MMTISEGVKQSQFIHHQELNMYHILFTTIVTLYIVSGVGNVAFA